MNQEVNDLLKEAMKGQEAILANIEKMSTMIFESMDEDTKRKTLLWLENQKQIAIETKEKLEKRLRPGIENPEDTHYFIGPEDVKDN